MIKITVLKNRIVDTDTFNKGIQMVKESLASINFPVEITIKEINVSFAGVAFNNQTIGSGIQVIPQQILSWVDGTEDIAFLIFNNNDVDPKPLNPTQSPIKKGNATPCQLCEQWYNGYAYVFRDFFLHEICHALFFLQNDVQSDITHNQQMYSEWQQKQNVDYYLWILKNRNMETITLTRNVDTGFETLGGLKSKLFNCVTLERPWKNNVKDISCIPKGTYTCKWTYSFKFPLGSYEVMNVLNRSGIRFHRGNYFFDVDGCILFGSGFNDINHDGKMDVINSTLKIKEFENLMNKKSFILEIK